MMRVLYCSRRISFVVNFCCWLISSLTSMARDALRVCHCCLLVEILWTLGCIALRVSWKLRASEAEVVVIVAPTRTRVGQDWRDIISKFGQELRRLPIPQLIAHITLACNHARSIVSSCKHLQFTCDTWGQLQFMIQYCDCICK